MTLGIVQPEPDPFQSGQEIRIEFSGFHGVTDMRFAHQGHRHRKRDQVGVFERAAAIVENIRQLGAGLDADDIGGAALDHGDRGAAGGKILRHVVTAVAGADDDGGFAPPVFAIRVATGMDDLAGERIQARQIRHVRNAADARRHDDVFWRERANATFRVAQNGGPSPPVVIEARLDQFGPGPEIQLHRLDVMFEPVGEFVFRNVDRPVRRERHVRQMIDMHLIVQRQGMIALAPVVADAGVPVDDQRVDAKLGQARRNREASLTAAHDQNRRIAVGIGLRRHPFVQPVRPLKIP